MITLDQLSAMSRRAVARTLTNADRSLIVDLSAKWGIRFNPNTRCNQCWHDQTLLLIIHARKLLKKYGAIE